MLYLHVLSFLIFVKNEKFPVDPVMVENINTEERRNANKVDKLNSYTIAAGGKVRETLIDYFMEFM